MAFTLPPAPIGEPTDSFAWQQWYLALSTLLTGTSGSIAWALIDKSGSNLTDIVTRNHNSLQSVQGGASNDYYHLTSAQLTALLLVTSGVYNPTRSAEANLDSNVTMTEAQYIRVGATVTVSGRFTADPTLAATTTSFELTLPVTSNIGAAEDVAGVAFCGSIAGQGAEIIGVAANDTAKVQWKSSDITSQTWSYTFTYQVI